MVEGWGGDTTPDEQYETATCYRPDVVDVTEVDHIAYIAFNNMPRDLKAEIYAGKWDATSGMQILAKHRLSGIDAGLERAAVIHEKLPLWTPANGFTDKAKVIRAEKGLSND